MRHLLGIFCVQDTNGDKVSVRMYRDYGDRYDERDSSDLQRFVHSRSKFSVSVQNIEIVATVFVTNKNKYLCR